MPIDSLEALRGLPFFKMTGSGNDFVFFDGRQVDSTLVTSPSAIQAICNRHNGIGADGVVVLQASGSGSHARMVYYNSDGSRADLCGNATLCATALGVSMGYGPDDQFVLDTDAGLIPARIRSGLPEIDLGRVDHVESDVPIPRAAGEERIGFAMAGIPHLVVLAEDVERIDLSGRGPTLRHDPTRGTAGANVNWVSRSEGGRWRYRTFERGVEGETLACGTGAIATAALLVRWGLADSPVTIRSSSGRDLEVRIRPVDNAFAASLRGEGRVVFDGRIGNLVAPK